MNRQGTALTEAGFTNLYIVEEQAMQSGDFPTVVYPNWEEADAFKISMELG